jgi:hypothetical protein
LDPRLSSRHHPVAHSDTEQGRKARSGFAIEETSPRAGREPLLPDIALAECAAVGIAIYAPIDDGDDFSFIYLNPAGTRIAGCDKQAPIGTHLSQSFLGAADIGLTETLRRVYHSGEPETL